jgi:transcriptional regulator NrdR family protein
MADNELFGYGTGYVPQTKSILESVENGVPEVILDFIMDAVRKDIKKQNIRDIESEDFQDIIMETVSDIAYDWVARVREAANSGDEDALHFMLLPF